MGMIIGFTNVEINIIERNIIERNIIERNIELFLWWNYSNPHIRI
jgi:hypothetical protein